VTEFPPGSTRARGQRGEDLVAARAGARGLEIIARNVEAAGAEIDLIARGHDGDAPLYVFIEVRSRAHDDLGTPIQTVGSGKRRHLVRAATSWLVSHDLLDRVGVRFDVVGVTWGRDDDESIPPHVEWIEGAFEVDGRN
jgi:putative endonuclease